MLTLLLLACAAPDPAPSVLRGQGLGTTWVVKWHGASASPDAVEAAVVGALSTVDARMSTWRDDSELSRIRAADGPVAVSEETALVVDMALDLAEATGGAFDPTVQPLVELWGFHGAPRAALPTGEELAAARAQVGHQRVVVSRDAALGPRVDAGGTALDLSAIAKGWAVDRVSLALSGLGVGAHMVEIGGEVRVHGAAPGGGAWRLGVDAPVVGAAPGAELAAVVGLNNLSFATSGNYRNLYEVDGVRLVHTLDPREGRPVDTDVLSASVVAPDCATADGWATALMVLGVEGLPLIEARPWLEALLLIQRGDGWEPVGTSGMSRFLSAGDASPSSASTP